MHSVGRSGEPGDPVGGSVTRAEPAARGAIATPHWEEPVTNWDDEWAELIEALCADDPGRVGTIGHQEGELAPVRPTRFGWLYGFDWWPAGVGTGLAMLELSEPGTMPAEAWEPLCGPLREAQVTREGHLLVGRRTPAGSARQATLMLVTDESAEGVRARVLTVRISVEPVAGQRR